MFLVRRAGTGWTSGESCACHLRRPGMEAVLRVRSGLRPYQVHDRRLCLPVCLHALGMKLNVELLKCGSIGGGGDIVAQCVSFEIFTPSLYKTQMES